MSNEKKSRFNCLKPEPDDTSNNESYITPSNRKRNRFMRSEQKPPQINSRWKRSQSPPKERNSFGEDYERKPRSEPSQINSRWKRSQSPPKERNSFQYRNDRNNDDRNRDDNRGGGYNRGGRSVGFGSNRRYLGRRGESSRFEGVKKDSDGLPILFNSTQKSFNIGSVVKHKAEKQRKKKTPKKVEPKTKLKPFKQSLPTKTKEEKEAEEAWTKAMLLQYQYVTDSEEESEEEYES